MSLSGRFERSLLGELRYSGHSLVAEAAAGALLSARGGVGGGGGRGGGGGSVPALVLDLGAGTGLVGAALRDRMAPPSAAAAPRGEHGEQQLPRPAAVLVGVDLSDRMVSLAREKVSAGGLWKEQARRESSAGWIGFEFLD